MVNFENDYNVGAHPLVLKRLNDINNERFTGYGMDPLSASAKAKIVAATGVDDAEVVLLVGGTVTNAVVISTLLKDYEGVVSADTGHVSVHEAGAVEQTGHKVLTVPGSEGKISADQLGEYLRDFYLDANHDHMVFPGMVYISHPTEYGTLYTGDELRDLHAICQRYDIPLYLDGARLAYALASDTGPSLGEIAASTDVFYIGGTKCGALFGEAVVYTGRYRPVHMITSVKKRGALLAKGWLLGAQFDTLFTDGLYEDIGRHAIEAARRMNDIFEEAGFRYFLKSPTNQQYIIMDNSRIEELSESVRFSFWEKFDETSTIVRFVTSWATTKEDLAGLRGILL